MLQRWPQEAGTTAGRARARNTTRTTTAHMYWIRTATISRPSVTTRLTPPNRLDSARGRRSILRYRAAVAGRSLSLIQHVSADRSELHGDVAADGRVSIITALDAEGLFTITHRVD